MWELWGEEVIQFVSLKVKIIITSVFYTKCVFSCSDVSDSLRTSWTVAHQAPLSMEFSRQEHWSGLPFPTPGLILFFQYF